MSSGHERVLVTVRCPQAIAQDWRGHRSAAAFRRRGPDCPRRKPPLCWTLTAHGSAASARLEVAGSRADRRTGRREEGGIGDVICGDCGETNKPGTEFCMFCGAYLGWQEQEPAGANEVTQVLPAQPPAPPRPARNTPPAPSASVGALGGAGLGSARTTRAPSGTAARSEPARKDPQPSPVAVVAAPAPPPAPAGCPTCGRAIDPARRFCGHCGEQFIRPGTSAPVTRSTQRSTWWTRLWDSKDRVARRTYRRSLPPLYRWRRVIITVLALGLIGGGLTVVGPSPKAFVLARYYDVRTRSSTCQGSDSGDHPAGGVGLGHDAGGAVRLHGQGLADAVDRLDSGQPCGAPPTTAVIQLSFSRTRIREIDLRAGLLKNEPEPGVAVPTADDLDRVRRPCVPEALEDLERADS